MTEERTDDKPSALPAALAVWVTWRATPFIEVQVDSHEDAPKDIPVGMVRGDTTGSYYSISHVLRIQPLTQDQLDAYVNAQNGTPNGSEVGRTNDTGEENTENQE